MFNASQLMTIEPILRLQNIVKRFGDHLAVNNISLDIFRGEILALLGENGAGKSSLIKILAGIYQQDSGKITFPAKSTESSTSSPIAFIHQDLGLIEWQTVAENIALVLGYPRRFGLIDWYKVREQAKRALDIVGGQLDPDARVFTLSRAEKSLLAIARALALKAEILVLDEPTAALPANDVERLFNVLAALRNKGVGMIYVTHRLDEVMQLSDRVLVMRNGNSVLEGPTQDYDIPTLIQAITGETQREASRFPLPLNSNKVLQLKDVVVDDVGPISFDLHQGEMLALVGLRGAGQENIGRLLFGLKYLKQGNIRLNGQSYDAKNPRQAIKKGIGLLSGEREKESLAMSLTTTENLFLNPSLMGRSVWLPDFSSAEQERAWQLFDLFNIRPRDLRINISALSGGNQQKIALARWIQLKTPILILEDPTAGVDMGARAEIYQQLAKVLQQGASLIVISNDFEEIAHLCNRALVFNQGQIVGELINEQVTFANLLSLASVSKSN